MAETTALNPESSAVVSLMQCMPPEIRVQIFHKLFKPARAREVINIVRIDGKLDLQYKDHQLTEEFEKFECYKLWLQPHIVGLDMALEAAEALYKSQYMFGIQAADLVDVLQCCPLSGLANPGLTIERLILFMDETKSFTAAGKPGSFELNPADMQCLAHDWHERRQLRSTAGRTRLMRQCWSAISQMPNITHLECKIMPHSGKQYAEHILSWEIRDILPAMWHFRIKGIDVRVCLRTWKKFDHHAPNIFERRYLPTPDREDPTIYEKPFDLSAFLPWTDTHLLVPNESDRMRAQRVLRQGFDRCLPTAAPATRYDTPISTTYDIQTFHRVRFYDALANLHNKLFPLSVSNSSVNATTRAYSKLCPVLEIPQPIC